MRFINVLLTYSLTVGSGFSTCVFYLNWIHFYYEN